MSNYIRNFLNFIYLRWLSLTIIFLTIIFLASLYPVDSSTKISANDKVLHLVSYFILSFPASYRKPISYRLILTFFICIGGFIEIIQPYFHRSRELSDFYANTLGIFIGVTAAHMFKKL